jgi:prophage tail gpP-like protein
VALSENKNTEVYYNGKNIDDWADINVVKKLRKLFLIRIVKIVYILY